MLYFIDKPLPRRPEEAPIAIALNQAAGSVWLGADLDDVTSAEPGVYVQKVFPNSPAELGGLKRADVITSVDTVKITSTADLATFLQGKKDGDRIKLRVLRNNKKESLSLVLKARPAAEAVNPNVPAVGMTPTRPNATPDVNGNAWLGLDVQSLDAVMMSQLKLADPRGVIISYVVPGSPAAQSGLVRGDVVRTVDKVPVNDRIGFSEVLQGKSPGALIKLEIIRNGFTQEVGVTAAVLPNSPTGLPPQELPPADIEVEASWLGLTVVPIDPLEAKELGLPPETRGIAVDGISIGPAFNAGFQVGDIIMAINGMPTASLRQFKDATEGAKGAMVDVWRGGRHRFVTIASPGLDRQGNQLPNSAAASQVAQQLPVDNGMRIVAVAAMGSTSADQVSPMFTKSPYFILVDLKKGTLNAVANTQSEATGILAAKWLMQNHIDAVITGRIGPRAYDALSDAKIAVYAGVFGSIEDVIQAFREGKLVPSVAVFGSASLGKR
ncbi:MAG: PDZ domain-containing protein [Deltaproteobacteria bacterium]|nr:PDZ domain-containing protein [Deltaproteobacteria bacterium]